MTLMLTYIQRCFRRSISNRPIVTAEGEQAPETNSAADFGSTSQPCRFHSYSLQINDATLGVNVSLLLNDLSNWNN
jgi:hypothetical protein